MTKKFKDQKRIEELRQEFEIQRVSSSETQTKAEKEKYMAYITP